MTKTFFGASRLFKLTNPQMSPFVLIAISTVQFVCDLYLQGCSSHKSHVWILTMLMAMPRNIPYPIYKVCGQDPEGLRPYARWSKKGLQVVYEHQTSAGVFSTAKCCVDGLVDPYRLGVNCRGLKSVTWWDAAHDVHGHDGRNWSAWIQNDITGRISHFEVCLWCKLSKPCLNHV